MNRLLLSLWLAGAIIFGVTTLISTYAIIGWPSGEKETVAVEAEPAESGASTAQQLAQAPDRVASKQGLTTQGAVAGDRAATPDEGNAAAPPLPPGVAFLAAPPLLAEGEGLTQGRATAPAKQSKWARVSRKGANVRSSPSSRAPHIATLPPGTEVRVLSRDGKWIKVTDSVGSETGWIYRKLVKPIAAPSAPPLLADDSAAAVSMGGRQPSEGEWVIVSTATATVRASPSEEAPMLFAFPAGRQARIITRRSGWVQVVDAGSGAVGWIDETAIAPAGTLGPDQETLAAAAQERATPPGDRPRGWGQRRGGRMAGILRRALRAF